MDPDRISEAAQFARKLYQAVLTLQLPDGQPRREVHRMAKAIALAEVMAMRPIEVASAHAIRVEVASAQAAPRRPIPPP